MKHIIWSIGHTIKLKDIVNAQNCVLSDSKGNEFIDLESGVWCTSIGHSNPRLIRAMNLQLNEISHTGFCYSNPIIEKVAKKVLAIANLKGGKCEFFCSGSEAVEFGMRVARILSVNMKALTFSDSYFGAYGDATEKDNDRWFVYNWLDCSCNSGEGNCTGKCKDFDNIPFDDIGIFIFEPGSSSGFVRFPDKQLIRKIINKIEQNNGIVMVNEITTGVGRTGKWFGYQHYNISPDIVAIGKGIGNGYPVSITAISNIAAKKLEKTKLIYSQSHQNDPLGAAVANEVINTIEDDGLLDRSKELGDYLYSQLNTLKIKYQLIKEVRARGLMIAIEFKNSAVLIYEELIIKGFIVAKRANSEVLRLDPALTIEYVYIDKFLEALAEILTHLSTHNFNNLEYDY